MGVSYIISRMMGAPLSWGSDFPLSAPFVFLCRDWIRFAALSLARCNLNFAFLHDVYLASVYIVL
jgi:hypothetical protein